MCDWKRQLSRFVSGAVAYAEMWICSFKLSELIATLWKDVKQNV